MFRRNKPTFLDFSGHDPDCPLRKANVENVADPDAYIKEARRLIDTLSDSEISDAQAGRIILVLPGMGTLVGTFLAEWHGRYGYFPRITFYVRNSQTGEFNLSKRDVNLQNVRYTARRTNR